MNLLTALAQRLNVGRHSELYAWQPGRVVKLFQPGYSVQAIEAELQYARKALELGVPTPRAEEIIGINGRSGIVFERCEGPTMFELIRAGAIPVERLAQVFFDVQRAIHCCPQAAFPEMKERLARKIAHARLATAAVKQRALAALLALPSGSALCHGDFHPANVIMSPKGPMVIDWLDAGHADPTLDAARSLLLLRLARAGQVDAKVRAAFVAAYEGCLREAWGGRPELIGRWQLPLAVARLAEAVEETECKNLLNLISTMPTGSPS